MLSGPGPEKMGCIVQIKQYYMVRVWIWVRDWEVGVPDLVPDAMDSRPIRSGIMSGLYYFLYVTPSPGSISRTM